MKTGDFELQRHALPRLQRPSFNGEIKTDAATKNTSRTIMQKQPCVTGE